jgi:hypothetical protein
MSYSLYDMKHLLALLPPNSSGVEHMWDAVHPYARIDSDPDQSKVKAEMNDLVETLLESLGYPRARTFLPPLPTVNEVEAAAFKRSTNIFKSWNRLHDLLLQHEDTLRKRWVKKSVIQRKQVLLEAWPGMATKHRPDFQALGKDTINRLLQSKSKYRKEFLYPYINLEDLTKPNNLLLFLNSRGHHRPDVFSFVDLQTQRTGRATKAILPAYLHGYTMLLANQTTPEMYGKLIPWGWKLLGLAPMLYGLGAQPGEGLLALEVQETLLSFLVKCSESILQDLLPLQPTIEPRPALLAPPSIIQHHAEWPSVAAVVAEAPYRVPIQLDFERLQALVSAKRSEAEDHIWSLREDPNSFHDFVIFWADHRYENIRDINTGKPHSRLGKPAFWGEVENQVVVKAYSDLMIWDMALNELSRLAKLRVKYGSGIHPGAPLPKQYGEELYGFKLFIENVLRPDLLDMFAMITPCSPPLRDRYIRQKVKDPNDPIKYDIRAKDPGKYDYFTTVLEFFTSGEVMTQLGFSELLDELDRITRSNTTGSRSAQPDLISTLVAASLSDLAVVSEIERQLNWHQPKILPGSNTEGILDHFAKKQLPSMKVYTASLGKELKLPAVGIPLTKFTYPSGKRLTATISNRMREAERNLDEFWSVVDQHYVENLKQPLHGYLQAKLGIPMQREIERTPEWIEPTLPSKPNSTQSTTTDTFSDLNIAEQSPVLDTTPVKVKVKTRSAQPEVNTAIPDVVIPSPPPCPTITVNKRAHKVFTSIFYAPSAETPPGEIPWTEFLYALSSAGFAIEKQHGSAWLFAPSGAAKRSIIFHEPHPASKVPIQIARRFGRRLKYAYGWTAETFVVDE